MTKTQRPRDQVHQVYNFILKNKRLDPEVFASEACLRVSVDEGISTEAAMRGLRWIISSLGRKGLPWKDGPKVPPLEERLFDHALKTPRVKAKIRQCYTHN